MKYYSIGYGGRKPDDFVAILKKHRISVIVDVRLRPDHSTMGVYIKAKDPKKGIENLLNVSGIDYKSLLELGNLFLEVDNWQDPYKRLFDVAGDILTERLMVLKGQICLMCAEKDVEKCHRKIIADYLLQKGHEVEHLK